MAWRPLGRRRRRGFADVAFRLLKKKEQARGGGESRKSCLRDPVQIDQVKVIHLIILATFPEKNEMKMASRNRGLNPPN